MKPDAACRTGAYALGDGRSLIVTGWNGSAEDLIYLLPSGEIAHLKPGPDGNYVPSTRAFPKFAFSDCKTGTLRLTTDNQSSVEGRKIPLQVRQSDFPSGSVSLHGRLVLPANGTADTVVVWIPGSNDDPATDDTYWQYLLPQSGIGVFTTDKRGTGSSSGTSTANFDLRAQDTVAAVGEVRRLMPGVARIGLFGVSQGGWVAPLAATKTAVSFVIVGYGLAEGITAQDRDVVADEVKAAGYGDRELQEARMLSDATAGILISHAQSGWDRFAQLEKRFGGEAWLKAIRTNSETGVLLSQPLAQIEQTWRSGADDTMFGYNPIPAIYAVSAPQLWVLAGEDHTAPSARTAAIIGNIEAAKPDIDLVVIRHADHGMIATPRAGDTSTRIAPAFFDVVRDWITAKHLPAPTDEIFVKSGRPR